MSRPNFTEEKKLWRQGIEAVAGLDEAGRGPLAGPVVAATLIINSKCKIQNLVLDFCVDDSKKLSAVQREKIYEKLIKCKDIKWGIGIVSEKVIDKINILQATKLSMSKAIDNLIFKSQFPISNKFSNPNFQIDFLLLDGNFTLNNVNIPQKAIIKGDSKVFSIAAASIIAKVTRDRIMQKIHKKYPQYGFDKHKGYGTKAHFANLEKFGPCKIHRKTFWPVSKFMQ